MWLKQAVEESSGRAGRLLADSHAEYPAFRHLFPDHAQRRRVLPPFMTAAVRDTIRYGRCYLVGEDSQLLGVALWFPPGAGQASGVRQLLMMPLMLRAMVRAGRRAPMWARAGARLEGQDADPTAWHLRTLGVSPIAQRRGVGRRLMAPVLAEADEAGAPCTLATSEPANIDYYARFGFTVSRPMQPLFPNGPSYVWMRRPAGGLDA